jgi:asparagine synthase (glutamine-hydrolysing)
MGGMLLEQIKASGVEDYINMDAVERMVQKHRSGQGDFARRIWTIYVFALWHLAYMEELPKKAVLAGY